LIVEHGFQVTVKRQLTASGRVMMKQSDIDLVGMIEKVCNERNNFEARVKELEAENEKLKYDHGRYKAFFDVVKAGVESISVNRAKKEMRFKRPAQEER